MLEDGSADVWVTKFEPGSQPNKVMTYKAGSAFGELALLYSAPRAASVRAVATCRLWVMKRGVFNAVKRNFTHEVSGLWGVCWTRAPFCALSIPYPCTTFCNRPGYSYGP